MPVVVGSTATWGQVIVYNSSHDPVVLDGAVLADGDGSGALVVSRPPLTAGPSRAIGVDGMDGEYPPDRVQPGTSPLPGTVVPASGTPGAESGVEILVGLTPTRPGTFWYRRMDVTYHALDGRRHTLAVDQAVIVCAGIHAGGSCYVDSPWTSG